MDFLSQKLKNFATFVKTQYTQASLKKRALFLLLFAFLIFVFNGFFYRAETLEAPEEPSNLLKLTENIRRYYQNRPDYWGLNSDSIIKNKIVPLALLKNDRIISGFGTDILVGNTPNGSMLMPGARSFNIIYSNLNKKQCIELASGKFDEKFWLGIIDVTINNSIKNEVFSWNDKKNILPIKKNIAKEICKSSNTVIFHIE